MSKETREAIKQLEMEQRIPAKITTQVTRDRLAGQLLDLRTEKQLDFVTNLLAGVDPRDAYALAYPDCNPKLLTQKTWNILRHPKIREIMETVRDGVAVMIDASQPAAVQALRDVAVNGKSEKAKTAAAKTLLEQARGTPMRRVEIKSVNWHGSFDKSELRKAMRRHQEANTEDEVIDIDTDD